jgi:3-hydroxyisobutyrate dehydrogenase-like beta-hydroxyacid dehydrogenase
MGCTVGASARAGGARVLWCSQERGLATRERAEKAGLEDTGSLDALVAQSDCIVSVCPPHAALEVADAVLALGFTGTYLDANAVSPETARLIEARVCEREARFVDGGIVGPPARAPGTTRLYLSGEGSAETAALFVAGPLEAIPIRGSASALKMAYAAYTKGTSALLIAIRALARSEGVDDALLAEWARSIPDLPQRSEGAMRGTLPKAWRFIGEMREIARSFEDAGLPGGFHEAAAEIYTRLAPLRESDEAGLDEVIAALLRD